MPSRPSLRNAAFESVLTDPTGRVLYADYDGGKNYFTPYSYVTGLGADDRHDHPLKVYGQHYPLRVAFRSDVTFTDFGLGILRAEAVNFAQILYRSWVK